MRSDTSSRTPGSGLATSGCSIGFVVALLNAASAASRAPMGRRPVGGLDMETPLGSPPNFQRFQLCCNPRPRPGARQNNGALLISSHGVGEDDDVHAGNAMIAESWKARDEHVTADLRRLQPHRRFQARA